MAKARVRRTLDAERDVREILLETFRTFGPGQLTRYAQRIDEAVDALADQPLHVLSRARPDIGRNVRSLHVAAAGPKPRRASHIVFYRVTASAAEPAPPDVVILRILHERMVARRRVLRALGGDLKRS